MRCSLICAILLVGCGNNTGAGTDGGGDDGPGDGGNGDGTVDDGMESDGPPISNCPAGTWCTETPPQGVTQLIHAVDAASANDVFAVGDGGTIVRRQNGTWTKLTSNTTANLRGIWVASSTDAFAAGGDGTIVRWNGTTWSAVPNAPDIDYTGVWGAAADDVWFVGTGGSAYHWNGSSFTLSIVTGTPVSISGSASNNVWVAAESGKVSRYTTSWQLCGGAAPCAVTPNSFFAVGVRAADDVWASLPGMGTMRWNGSTWTTHSTAATLFAAIYAPGASNAWGAGGTKVGHWDGSAWTVTTPVANLTSSLYGIGGTGPHAWAVGDNATILYHHD